MTLVKGLFRILFLLLMQSAIWSLCVCKPTEKAELEPWDDDDWYRRLRTLKPISWTVKPIDTSYRHTPYNDIKLELAIFLPLGLIFLILLFCKRIMCGKGCSVEDSTSDAGRITHPPPRVEPPHVRIYTTDEIRNSQPLQTPTRQSVTSSGTSNVDIPPGYSDVVLSDLGGGSTNFPGVHISPASESPPPRYEEGNVPRF